MKYRKTAYLIITVIILCLLVETLAFAACDGTASNVGKSGSSNTVSPFTSPQNVVYNSDPKNLLIRTFRGGGLTGSFELAPDISIYGDGTFILGTHSQGQISPDSLQHMLDMLVNTYGLPDMKRQSFSDTQDQNATFLELTLKGKTQEFVYGSFGNQQESVQDMDEYHQLDKAFIAINDALTGSTHPYVGTQFALLARRIVAPTQQLVWPLDFSLGQVVAYECSRDDVYSQDYTSTNTETGCVQYSIPHNAVLLTNEQLQSVQNQLPQGQQQGQFYDAATGFYYAVTLRPLLPDELASKALAMFGSAQDHYIPVPLLINVPVPPIPTPTPKR